MANTNSTVARVAPLLNTAQDLLKAALAPASRTAYHRSWQKFQEFATMFGFSTNLPLSPASIALFIADLVNKGLKPTTVSSHISALGYVHKLRGIPDSTAAFFIQKMLSSYHKHCPSLDVRLPIDKQVLDKLVAALHHTCQNGSERILFKAMFTLAFHAFLRIGEMTVTGQAATNPNVIEIHQVTFGQGKMNILFIKYKHSTGKPFTLTIEPGAPGTCPVQAMREYIAIRGSAAGPLFTRAPQVPVTRSYFNSQLRLALAFCNYSLTQFSSHSFRIGAATTAAAQGRTDAQIRQLGRWKSDAFKQYIRNSHQSSAL